MMTPDELAHAIQERNRAFETGDLEWAARNAPPGTSAEAIEIGFHQARLDCVVISDQPRIDSRNWLLERGLNRAYDMPIDPKHLPE